jgi:cytochrome c oxidase subunit 2
MEIPIWFEARSAGKFQVGCAQLCGLGHYEMKAKLTIESKQDFQRWLDEEHSALGLD